ncbi:MAG TPA: hypothetical protein PKW18_03080 [Candidatus Sumerlaeota bacterium]|nr:MAG: hypothetical protein BWY12_01855 [candidate division BRC1 bacterium ADurb.Bin183]HOE62779.1 hypothetical protein [Candidatus Sumerlaeota bacterium]HRR29692.1 hypothetical protein [Candidatus Sumerlaeia bacterium]HON50361.1 hypothetical protein [Candidatus Sumerlaeota bacterium]HOR63577.1 hypothetical protein [Candidatus Sumerlaeota bacterium]
MKTKITFLALFLFSVNQLLMADIITLTNGQTIEGESKEVGDNIEIITNTSRMTIPKNRIANIVKSEYTLKPKESAPQTVEPNRQKKAQDLFKQAEHALDGMDAPKAIELLVEAVNTDPVYEDALERLIRLLADRLEFKKAKEYLEQLKQIKPLPDDIKAYEARIEEGYKKQTEKEQYASSEGQRLPGAPTPVVIPQGTPAADYTGAYYVEYSYCARIQQSNDIASVALYTQNPQTPAIQFSARVAGNCVVFDLSRINPSYVPNSIFAFVEPDGISFSLSINGDIKPMVGKKITNGDELTGFLQILAGNYDAARIAFEEAVRKQPENTHALFGLGRAQMHTGKADMALTAFDMIKNKSEFKKYFCMEKLFNISRDYAEAMVMSAKGENAIDDYEASFKQFPLRVPDFGPFMGLIERTDNVNDINVNKIKSFLEPFNKSLKVIENTYQKPFCRWAVDGALASASDTPNDSNYITVARMLLLQAKLASYEKRFSDAMLWSKRLMKMGQHLNHGRLETRQLGIKIQILGIEAFRDLICVLEKPEQAAEVSAILKEIIQSQPTGDYQSLVRYERVEWPNANKAIYMEAAQRVRIETTPLLFLPIAAASKRYYLTHNHLWPISLSMLVPEFLPEPIQDPFSKNPINVFPEQGIFRIYSIGPDRKDDKGYLPFDIAAGLGSDGDIIMDIK